MTTGRGMLNTPRPGAARWDDDAPPCLEGPKTILMVEDEHVDQHNRKYTTALRESRGGRTSDDFRDDARNFYSEGANRVHVPADLASMFARLLCCPLDWTIESVDPQLGRQSSRDKKTPIRAPLHIYPFGNEGSMRAFVFLAHELNAEELRLLYVQTAFASLVFDTARLGTLGQDEELRRFRFNGALEVARAPLISLVCGAYINKTQFPEGPRMLLASILLTTASLVLAQTPDRTHRQQLIATLLSLYHTTLHGEENRTIAENK